MRCLRSVFPHVQEYDTVLWLTFCTVVDFTTPYSRLSTLVWHCGAAKMAWNTFSQDSVVGSSKQGCVRQLGQLGQGCSRPRTAFRVSRLGLGLWFGSGLIILIIVQRLFRREFTSLRKITITGVASKWKCCLCRCWHCLLGDGGQSRPMQLEARPTGV